MTGFATAEFFILTVVVAAVAVLCAVSHPIAIP